MSWLFKARVSREAARGPAISPAACTASLSLQEKNENNYLFINQQLEGRGLRNISVGKLEFLPSQEESADAGEHKRQAKKTYFRSINLVREVAEGAKNQKMVNIRKDGF